MFQDDSPGNFERLLSTLRETLGQCQTRQLEWSLRLSKGTCSEHDRFTCWAVLENSGRDDGRDDVRDDVSLLARQLERLSAPPAVLEAHRRVASHSIKQGLGFTRCADGFEPRLYLHHREPVLLRDRYESWRWNREGQVTHATYEFHFLPKSPEGEGPLELVHPQLRALVAELLELPRLQQLSGFWLRRCQQRLDQVDLILPWEPPLSALEAPLRRLARTLECPEPWLEAHAGAPLRHIAFNTDVDEPPQCTLYFSGRNSTTWPDSLPALQRLVRRAGEAERVAGERFLQALPILPPPTEVAVGKFYDTQHRALWRQVLGPGMHYHAGSFEQPLSPTIPDDETATRAFRRAVEELYPFIPPGSRVYDLGCGWGGPMQMLVQELRCPVVGITASATQYQACAALGLQVRWNDVESTLPPGKFDVMLLLESFEHIQHKARLLAILRAFGKRLIMRVNCQDRMPNSVNFGGTMHMISTSQLRALVEAAGFRIVSWRACRTEGLPSVQVWHQRLQRIGKTDEPHLETLRAFCERVLVAPEAWGISNPLIELIAE